MDTGSEPLPTDEPDSVEQQTDALAPVLQHTDNNASVQQPVAPASRVQRITRFLEDIRPTPGSNVVRIYGISDCVIAVAFTLFVVNIHLPPEIWRVFALTQLVTSTTLLLMWIVARADHLLDPEIPPEYLRYTTARLLVIPIGTLFSIGITFFNVWLAEGIFLFFYVLGWVLRSFYYRHHSGAGYLEGTVRMCSITDNMTAVAITFLITTITGPLLSNNQQSLSTALGAVVAELPVYGLTFLIVGFYWLSHHRIFMLIRRHTMTLIWLNFGFLLFIELQPLFNALRASYPTSQLTAILYVSEQAATGLMLLVIWWYVATGHRLIDTTMDRFEIMFFALRALLLPMIFILSIAIILFLATGDCSRSSRSRLQARPAQIAQGS